MQFTYKELLENYKVVIPQIQRDYAQGRESESDLRKGFISKISEALTPEGTALNLDFIYGYADNKKSGPEIFVPLDGQQRLTTLWLVHWFLAPKEEISANGTTKVRLAENDRDYLIRFTYDTRISSKRFFRALVTQPIELDDEVTLSERILNSPWFMASWSLDPTIRAVLNMLDALEEEDFGSHEDAFQKLVTSRQITFDYIDIKSDEFKLTDELYIKMNSRGKPLTPFENFKAMFSGLLAAKDTAYHGKTLRYENADVTYQQYFAFNVDGKWMDLFWKYKALPNTTIDSCFLNFITYIAEFRYFRKNPLSGTLIKRDYDFLKNAFRDEDDVRFLFDALDFLAELPQVATFFETLFGNISTFDFSSKNYFRKAITNANFDVMDKTLLYGTLYYGIHMETVVVDDNYKDFIRVLRNLLLTVRQPNQSKRIEYASNLRLNSVADYSKFIEGLVNACVEDRHKSTYEVLAEKKLSGFTRDALLHEQDKARLMHNHPNLIPVIQSLEEHKEIRGNAINFDLEATSATQKITSFREIWSPAISHSLITRAYLTIEDYSVKTHDHSSLGPIRYFGTKGYWNRILTATDKEEKERVSDSLDCFLTAYQTAIGTTAEEKLNCLIDSYTSDSWDWKRYFIAYPQISAHESQNLNIYAWNDVKGYDINHLGNSGKQPLHSYHQNPYMMILSDLFTNSENMSHYHGRFGDESCIALHGKATIYCVSQGWRIYLRSDFQLDQSFITKYGLTSQNGYYLLAVSENDNRIEIAEKLINDLK